MQQRHQLELPVSNLEADMYRSMDSVDSHSGRKRYKPRNTKPLENSSSKSEISVQNLAIVPKMMVE